MKIRDTPMKMANIKIIKVYLLVYKIIRIANVKAAWVCPEGNELTLCSKLNGLILSYPCNKKYFGRDTPSIYLKILHKITAVASEKIKCLQIKFIILKELLIFIKVKFVLFLRAFNFKSFFRIELTFRLIKIIKIQNKMIFNGSKNRRVGQLHS